MKDDLIAILIFTAVLTLGFIIGYGRAAEDTPRLVGYGCEGSKGPIFANEEDHFPHPCDAIEGN